MDLAPLLSCVGRKWRIEHDDTLTTHIHTIAPSSHVLLDESQTKVEDYYRKENKKLYIKGSLNI